ncbi:MAG: hypothetical protein K2H30_00735, partial [Clostridia bacterium]|nr:hypothetical protein [Clostridia bacterium]
LVLAKIEAELAQIRAEQHASHGYSAPAPVYGPQPANSDASAVMLAKMEAEFAKMQAKQEASQEVNAAKMELEFYKLHGMPANYGGYGYNQFAQQSAKPMDLPNRPQNYSAEEVGAIMAAMMRNMGVNPAELSQTKPAELPQSTEEGKNSASASYPPDAVITTTTTVDTTKNGNARAKQTDDGRLFDIDGFYDNFENK